MELHLLGTSGYHPSELRHTACLMLPELGVVLDAGTAMFRVREHLVTDTLDIFLTHAHLDHCIGLTYLFDVLHGKKMQHVRIHGEQVKIDAIQKHLFSENLFPAVPPCEWVELSTDKTNLPGDGKLMHFPLTHPGGAVGFRLDFPEHSIAYVSDTSIPAEEDYTEIIRNVDLLVHECHFDDTMEERAKLTGHSCLTDVCELAATAEVGLLVLVHINPLSNEEAPLDLELAKSIFPETLLGADNMMIEL